MLSQREAHRELIKAASEMGRALGMKQADRVTCGQCLLSVIKPCKNYIAAAQCPTWRRAKPKPTPVDPTPFGKLNVPNPDFLHEIFADYEASRKPE